MAEGQALVRHSVNRTWASGRGKRGEDLGTVLAAIVGQVGKEVEKDLAGSKGILGGDFEVPDFGHSEKGSQAQGKQGCATAPPAADWSWEEVQVGEVEDPVAAIAASFPAAANRRGLVGAVDAAEQTVDEPDAVGGAVGRSAAVQDLDWLELPEA